MRWWKELSPQGRWRRFGPPGVFTIAIIAVVLAYVNDTFSSLELDTIDARFRVRGAEKPPDDLIIVGIDSRSLTELDVYPLPRRMHARVIDILRGDGAAQISYDIQFSEQTNRRDDNALIRAIDRTPHMVLASTETDERGRTDVLGGDRTLRLVGARAAFSAFRLDSRGIPRYVPRIDQNLNTFAVATIEADQRRKVDPDDEPGRNPWINYLGPARTFPTLPFVDVLRKEFEPGTFKDATVVVGATANNLQDVHDSPWRGELMPGPEVQANAIATIRDAWPLRSAPRGFEVLVIVLLTLIPAALARLMKPVAAFGAAVAIGGGYLGLAQVLFNSGTNLQLVYPILGLGMTGVGNLGLAYITTAFDRQRTRDTFSRFVPDAVVGDVLARAEGVRLGGEQTTATVLFSDIRGFTTFSESRSPEEVIGILNEYLSEMSDAILDAGGTLVAYLGDGIMAVFGAPIHQDDHADRALLAAQEMLGPRLEEFNRYAEAELGVEGGFKMGIGLNTGQVMSGMVGSIRRLEYTTIGDTVNTASRLEGATKGVDGSLLVADSTRNALLAGADQLDFVDEIEIRGREEKLKVWTLPGL